MDKIDAHQHFWQYEPVKDSWITTGMEIIQKDFMPDDLQPVLDRSGVNGCIAVQAGQSDSETEFLLSLARKYDFIKGVVGWTDLKAPGLHEMLAEYAKEPLLRGFRHILQGENDLKGFLADDSFSKGLGLLKDYQFTYDLLVFHDQMEAAISLVDAHPQQIFVLDHLGKPDLKTGDLTAWKKNIKTLGKYPHVYCKISGLVTEGDWNNWQPEALMPCLDTCVEAFGVDRLLFGSDWPVCLLATTYHGWYSFLTAYFRQFTAAQRDGFFGANAAGAYGLV